MLIGKKPLWVMLTAALALAVLLLVPLSEAQARDCGQVRLGGKSYELRVTKGKVTCQTARSTTRSFSRKKNCGGAQRKACKVGPYHCRAGLPGESKPGRRAISGYCYQLKKAIPAARDFSFYTPKRFKKAILLSQAHNRELTSTRGLRARQCGSIFLLPETGNPSIGGLGGLITAKRVKCKNARKIVKKCLKRGKHPRGWRVRTRLGGGRITLRRANKQILVNLVGGGTPPGLRSCQR